MPESVHRAIARTLAQINFAQKEAQQRHHTYDEELLQYEYMKNGNLNAAIPLSQKLFRGTLAGHLSDDAVRNYKYLFVASITLSCRFCIEGGMFAETAYNISDLYIQQVDRCRTVAQIFELHTQMFGDYTRRMAELKKENVFSRPVLLCMDYIDLHLHEHFTLEALAAQVGRTPNYLSALFHKEVGSTISDYTRARRIDTAKTLLQYTDYSCAEIASYLAFASHSHFNHVFKHATGLTPRLYRERYFRHNWQKG